MQRFVDEYLVDFNKTRAAIRAGYSPKAARNLGYETYKNPLVKAKIDEKIKELAINAEETTKLIMDIARGNLGDYFVTKKAEYTPKIEVPLAEIIKQIEDDIKFEEEYATYADFRADNADGTPGRDRRKHQALIVNLQNNLLRCKMELEKNPKATRIINGKTVLIDRPELDIAKLVADKERGRIKSVTPTEFGLKVELYAADNALMNIAKMQGLYAADNAQTRPQTLIIDWTGKHNGSAVE